MKASMTQEEPRVAPHRASWRAAQDELPSVASELARLRAEKEVDRALIAAQDARLAKAGADLEECKKLASGLITDIGAEKEARAVAERIARERAAEVQRLEAVLASECAVTDAYDAGLEAALDGKSLHDCPFGDFGPPHARAPHGRLAGGR
jgi:chromosome segregation ATPase